MERSLPLRKRRLTPCIRVELDGFFQRSENPGACRREGFENEELARNRAQRRFGLESIDMPLRKAASGEWSVFVEQGPRLGGLALAAEQLAQRCQGRDHGFAVGRQGAPLNRDCPAEQRLGCGGLV